MTILALFVATVGALLLMKGWMTLPTLVSENVEEGLSLFQNPKKVLPKMLLTGVLFLFSVSCILLVQWSLLGEHYAVITSVLSVLAIIGAGRMLEEAGKLQSRLILTAATLTTCFFVAGFLLGDQWLFFARHTYHFAFPIGIVMFVAACIGAEVVVRGSVGQRAQQESKYFFAFLIGTAVIWSLIGLKTMLFTATFGSNPFVMAIGLCCIVALWKCLFSAWNPGIKAVLLGTVVFWVQFSALQNAASATKATQMALLLGIIPVVILSTFILLYKPQRLNVILLAFFGGMIATAPILLYNLLVQHGTVLHFFAFEISFQSLPHSTDFLLSADTFSRFTAISLGLIGSLMTYLLVGAVEEGSKFWILRHSSTEFLRSMSDVLQISIIIAIGYSFAENMLNPALFVGFVSEYLENPGTVSVSFLIVSILFRSIIITFIHVLSTAVIGYYVGLAFFASPKLQQKFEKSLAHKVLHFLTQMLDIPCESLYRVMRLGQGLLYALIIHGLFNFLVSLPELLPSYGFNIDDVIGLDAGTVSGTLNIIFVGALIFAYLAGGTWLLLRLTRGVKEPDDTPEPAEKGTPLSELY